MSKSEGAPISNNTEKLNLNDSSVEEKELGDSNPDNETETQKEISPEEQLKNLEDKTQTTQQSITKHTESIDSTKKALNEAREKIGLPPVEEDPPSVLSNKDKIEKLQKEKESLDEQKKELIDKQEKEKLIQEEKEKVMQENLDELFKELEGLNTADIESLLQSGKKSDGSNIKSKSMGPIDSKIAKPLVKALKEGIKLLPEVLKVLPGLLKEFDNELTKEATERVEKNIENEKKEVEDKEKEGNRQENPEESGIPKPLENDIGQEKSAGGVGTNLNNAGTASKV